jgi:hypothetical protein
MTDASGIATTVCTHWHVPAIHWARAILSQSRAECSKDLSRIGTRWMIGVRETEA